MCVIYSKKLKQLLFRCRLHSGKIVNLCLKNSEPDTGIVFKRTDLNTNNLIYPNFNNVTNTSLNTTISMNLLKFYN